MQWEMSRASKEVWFIFFKFLIAIWKTNMWNQRAKSNRELISKSEKVLYRRIFVLKIRKGFAIMCFISRHNHLEVSIYFAALENEVTRELPEYTPANLSGWVKLHYSWL